MPRYHFNIYDGVVLMDKEGVELPHYPAARLEAVRRAAELLADNALAIAVGEDWRIEVTDDRGLILFQFAFVSSESSAIARGNKAERH